MLHHKEAHQATFEDIGEAAMCTKETAKYYTERHRPTRLCSKPYECPHIHYSNVQAKLCEVNNRFV